MHLLIVGAHGQLGQAMQAACGSQHSLTVWGRTEADISNLAIVKQVSKLAPDVVVNCAAWTNVDRAEEEADAAFAVNAMGALNLARACSASGATLVHVSTNEVFEGIPKRKYYEYDQPGPSSVYARSKLAGERATSQILERLYVVRVAWLFGPGGNSFPAKIMAAADRNGTLRVVDEEVGNPTYAPDAAAAIFRLLDSEHFGTYHLVNEGCASRFEFAQAVLQATGRGGIPLTPIKQVDWPRPAMPPLHAVLVNQEAAALGIRLRPWHEALQEYVNVHLEKSRP